MTGTVYSLDNMVRQTLIPQSANRDTCLQPAERDWLLSDLTN